MWLFALSAAWSAAPSAHASPGGAGTRPAVQQAAAEALPLPPVPEDAPEALRKGIAAWSTGDPLQAAILLSGAGDLGVHEQARDYYRARALRDLGQLQAAQAAFFEVVRRGPSATWFQPALLEVTRLARETGSAYEVGRVVTKLPPESFPAPASDLLHFVWATKVVDDDPTEARAHLALVSSSAPEHLSARFVEGELLRREGSYSGARDRFLEVAEAPPSGGSPLQVARANLRSDQALLALGRTYFEAGEHGTARDLYARMSKESPLLGEASFEEAWARFLLADHAGALKALERSAKTGTWQPERGLLRALIAFDSCRWSDVESSLREATAAMTPVSATLRTLAATYSGDARDRSGEVYRGLFGPSPTVRLPEALVAELARDGLLAGELATLTRIGAEESAVAAHAAEWGEVLVPSLQAVLKEERARYEKAAGARALALAERHGAALADVATRIEVLDAELIEARRADYPYEGAGCSR